ncbi:MAG: hypothetical protein K2N38_01755 [Oscillospiraceae bacterium]|nr:hypothetical protein [Oscillospiraceae bacterium]
MKKRIFLAAFALLLITGCSTVSEPSADGTEASQQTSRSQYEDEKLAPIAVLDTTHSDELEQIFDEWHKQIDEQIIKYADMLPSEYEEGIPDEMIYGIMTEIDRLMISHMTYYHTDEHKRAIYTDKNGERHISCDRLKTNDAEIVFEDGTPASEDDLTPGTAVHVQYEVILETFPGQMICTKIIILQ